MVGSNSTRFEGTVTSCDGAKGQIVVLRRFGLTSNHINPKRRITQIVGGFYGPNAEEIGFLTAFEKFGIHYVGSRSGTR